MRVAPRALRCAGLRRWLLLSVVVGASVGCTTSPDYIGKSCDAANGCPDGLRCIGKTCLPASTITECSSGERRGCYPGPPETIGVGICAEGTRLCTDAETFGGCFDAVVPVDETCNGLDDDCDGEIDEELDVPVSCGVGACAKIVSACRDGVPGTCTPAPPTAETCNGADDDCDGVVDDGFGGMQLSCGVGACRRAVAACGGGMVPLCMPGPPSVEVCNGVDDDCDGQTDEWFAETTLCSVLPAPTVSSVVPCSTGDCLVISGANFGPETEVRLRTSFSPTELVASFGTSQLRRGADPRTSITVDLPQGYARQLAHTSGLSVQVVNLRQSLSSGPRLLQLAITLAYSSAGTGGRSGCVQLLEPSDPNTWDDNYLCSTLDLGLAWSYRGPIASMSCVQVTEPADPDTWGDNYLCSSRPLGLRWSHSGSIAGLRCLRVSESVDPDGWDNNYLCF